MRDLARPRTTAEEMEASVFVDGGWYDGNLTDSPREATGPRGTPRRQPSRPQHTQQQLEQQQRRQGLLISGGRAAREDVLFSSPDSEDYLDARESWHTADWPDASRGASAGSTPSGTSPAGSSPTRSVWSRCGMPLTTHATTQSGINS